MNKPTTYPIPDRVAALPRDERGYPIPASFYVDPNGTANFRVLDREKWSKLVRNHCCGICGQEIVGNVWFIGGNQCVKYRMFTDAAMHQECAEYAAAVCPFIALPNMQYAS